MGLAVAASIQPVAIGITFKLLSALTGKKISSLLIYATHVGPSCMLKKISRAQRSTGQ